MTRRLRPIAPWSPANLSLILFALAVPQIYVLPRGWRDISLFMFVGLCLAPVVATFVLRQPGRWLLRDPLLLVILGLLVVRVAALGWSPTPSRGLAPIALLAVYLTAIVAMVIADRSGADLPTRMLRFYWPFVVAEALLVVVFRVLPGVESAFLAHAAPFFAGHNSVAGLFSDDPNNVFDRAKAGGLFINANVAGMFLGVNALVALGFHALTRDRRMLVLGLSLIGTVFFTGSKSAAVLAVALLVLPYGAYRLLLRGTVRQRRLAAIVAAVVGAAGIFVVSVSTSGLAGAMRSSFLGRTVIWNYGAEAFVHKPLLGLGYGGWDKGYALYAAANNLGRALPPHNLLLAGWASTGLLGVLLTIAYFVLLFAPVVRIVRRPAEPGHLLFALLAGAAMAWVLVQGMGENTDIFGEVHLIPVLALIIAIVMRLAAEERSVARHAHRRYRSAPVVPSVRGVHHDAGDGDADVPTTVHRSGYSAD